MFPFSPQLMHALSQPTISSPCDELQCSHLCLLAPAAKGRSGAPALTGDQAVREPTAVCRCPKGMLLSKDKMTCSLPTESSFILLLSRTAVYQVNDLIVVVRPERSCQLLVEFDDILVLLISNFILPSASQLVDLLALHASWWYSFEKNAYQPRFSPPWGNWSLGPGRVHPGAFYVCGWCRTRICGCVETGWPQVQTGTDTHRTNPKAEGRLNHNFVQGFAWSLVSEAGITQPHHVFKKGYLHYPLLYC